MSASPTSPTRLDAYLSELGSLWPADPDHGPTGGPTERRARLAVVPSTRDPRLLVPADNPRAAAAAMLRFSSALDARDVVTRVGFATLLRLGLSRRWPAVDLAGGTTSGSSVTAHLADVLGEPVDVSVGLGTARTNRKPVLEVFDRRGRRLAFAKIGTTAVSTAHVRAEADALRRLGEAALPDRLRVPRLIDLSTWNDLTVLVMTGLPTSALRRQRQWDLPDDSMRGLAAAFDAGRQPLTATPWWSWLSATPALLPQTVGERLAAVLERLAGVHEAPEPVGAWHGDWTPWNQSRTRHGLSLWDWERFETGVPVGLDRCHYAVNATTRRDGASVPAVLSGLEAAGLDRASARERSLGGSYLAAVGARYLRSTLEPGGELISDRADVVLDALECWLDPTAAGTR